MKYLSEYRNLEATRQVIDQIGKLITRPWQIMEICGGQTHGLVRNGLLELLPEEIRMIHGPGCPVCVTPVELIDQAVDLMGKGAVLCSFGDMIRVPGSRGSLLEAKSRGGDLRVLYSPLEAVRIARENPEKEVVFFAVGFETTAPANALSVLQAEMEDLANYSILVSHVLVPPAMEGILDDPFCAIDAFLGAGHVCAIMGYREYHPISAKYKIPIVVTGFEPLDLVRGIHAAVLQLENGRHEVENQYTRAVTEDGNRAAQEVIHKIFEITDRRWRGIGLIPNSGYTLRDSYAAFDASRKFSLEIPKEQPVTECIAGAILKGQKKPHQCPHFGKQCTPRNPMGAPMVSSEGACAAYFHFAANPH
jgi:hydrogenase expression/formation protein HypD